MSKPRVGKVYKSNDKLFTGYNKPRNVVVSKEYKETGKLGVSRILSLENKEEKKNNLMPIKDYGYFTKPSGIDYKVYSSVKGKNGRENINFGAMKDVNVQLDDEDINKMKHHIKSRGGKTFGKQKHYKKFKR